MDRQQLLADIKKLEEKYRLSYREIVDVVEHTDDTGIPFSIFNEKLGSLESVVKFLKDYHGLSLSEISLLLNRNVQPIRTTYLRAIKKYSGKLDCSSEEKIPLDILSNKEFSVLENLVSFLLDSGYDINTIASILSRGYKTIWTIKKRINSKR